MTHCRRRAALDDYEAEMAHDRRKEAHEDGHCGGPGPGGCELCDYEWEVAIAENQKGILRPHSTVKPVKRARGG